MKQIKIHINSIGFALSNQQKRGVSRVFEACFNRLTGLSNVVPFAYEDE